MDEQQLLHHYAGEALNGILSSPRWSSMLMDIAMGKVSLDEDAKAEAAAEYLSSSLAKISWGVAHAMIVEARERGWLDTPRP